MLPTNSYVRQATPQAVSHDRTPSRCVLGTSWNRGAACSASVQAPDGWACLTVVCGQLVGVCPPLPPFTSQKYQDTASHPHLQEPQEQLLIRQADNRLRVAVVAVAVVADPTTAGCRCKACGAAVVDRRAERDVAADVQRSGVDAAAAVAVGGQRRAHSVHVASPLPLPPE